MTTLTFDAAAMRDPEDRVALYACNECGKVDTEPMHHDHDMQVGVTYHRHIACCANAGCPTAPDDPAHCPNVLAARAAAAEPPPAIDEDVQ